MATCVATAFFIDLCSRRIPNKLVLLTLVSGLAWNALGPAGEAGGLFSPDPGALGLLKSLLGVLTGFLLFLPLYALRAMGAGDVKLFAAVGGFAGAAATLNIALLVLLAGGVLAVIRMISVRHSRMALQNTLLILGQMLPGSAGTFDPKTHTAWRMPYAVAIGTGTLAYAVWILTGHAPLLRF